VVWRGRRRKLKSSLDEQGRDTDMSMQQAEEEFLSLDDMARTSSKARLPAETRASADDDGGGPWHW
jgi:hypothetical protein